MFYTYTIEDSFFSNILDCQNIELSLEKLTSLLDKFEKNSCMIDCHDESRTVNLQSDFDLVYGSLLDSDCDIKKMFEIVWLESIKKRVLFNDSQCNCQSATPSVCSIDKYQANINRNIKSFPSFTLNVNNNNNKSCISVNNYRQDQLFQQYFDCTSYEEETLLNEAKGVDLIKKNWGSLIAHCKNNITFLDRNVFPLWDSNYAGGLRQFAKVIFDINPKLHFNIITKKAPHKSANTNRPKSLYDIRDEIISEIKKAPCKIELILCDNDAKFDHDRFIVFDNRYAAELSRGLDSFYAEPKDGEVKIDRYRIIYYKIHEVRKYLLDPIRNKTKDENFINFKNY